MSNQFEQFRELCAKTAEGDYDPNATFDQKEASVVMARYLCAKMIRALPLPAMPSQDHLKGFSMYFDREAWGHIVDGLILEKERSEKRKSDNPESNSNYIAARCGELLKEISTTSDLKVVSVMPEQAEPVAYPVSYEQRKRLPGNEHRYHFLPWFECTKKEYDFYKDNPIDNGWLYEVRGLFAEDPSALLARIAELEAEIQKLNKCLDHWEGENRA